jgi:hypothetical protein
MASSSAKLTTPTAQTSKTSETLLTTSTRVFYGAEAALAMVD